MQFITRMECRDVLVNDDETLEYVHTDDERRIRLQKYTQTSVRLQHTSTADLIACMIQGIVGQGYGIHSIVDVHGTNVFMKTIPITKTDLDGMYDPSIDQKIAQFRDHLREYGLGTHIGPTMHQIF